MSWYKSMPLKSVFNEISDGQHQRSTLCSCSNGFYHTIFSKHCTKNPHNCQLVLESIWWLKLLLCDEYQMQNECENSFWSGDSSYGHKAGILPMGQNGWFLSDIVFLGLLGLKLPLVQFVAWCWIGDKPLPELMISILGWCVTWELCQYKNAVLPVWEFPLWCFLQSYDCLSL